jgi:hypothetical protein
MEMVKSKARDGRSWGIVGSHGAIDPRARAPRAHQTRRPCCPTRACTPRRPSAPPAAQILGLAIDGVRPLPGSETEAIIAGREGGSSGVSKIRVQFLLDKPVDVGVIQVRGAWKRRRSRAWGYGIEAT